MYRPSQTPHLKLSSEGVPVSEPRKTQSSTNGSCPPLATQPHRLAKQIRTDDVATPKRARPPAFPLHPSKWRNDTSAGISLACKHSQLCYTSYVPPQSQTRVKLNRVFFPR